MRFPTSTTADKRGNDAVGDDFPSFIKNELYEKIFSAIIKPMIRYLEGTVFRIQTKEIIVLTTQGVGYQVFPAGSVLSTLQKGQSINIFIVPVIKENEFSLYGFIDEDEMSLFEKLISVSGIGPKTALQMLSIPVSEFMQALENGDVPVLTRVPGLGKKTAERLIVELRGKIDLSSSPEKIPQNISFQEAEHALKNLGYDSESIRSVLSSASSDLSAEDLVTYFLSSHG